MMASGLLQKIDLGERKISSNQKWLDGFTWNEEGLGASKKMAIFLSLCAAELRPLCLCLFYVS